MTADPYHKQAKPVEIVLSFDTHLRINTANGDEVARDKPDFSNC